MPFTKDNYIQLQGWMITDLKLKGNDLILFALVYGFCQDGESEFTGSINYVCSALNCSRPTAMKSLKSLESKGFISKKVEYKNGVSFNHYKTLRGVKKLYWGSKETLLGGSKETLPNNTISNNTINNKGLKETPKSKPSQFEKDKDVFEILSTKQELHGQNLTLWESLIIDFIDWKKEERNETYKAISSVKAHITQLIRFSGADIVKAGLVYEKTYAGRYAGIYALKEEKGNATVSRQTQQADNSRQMTGRAVLSAKERLANKLNQ